MAAQVAVKRVDVERGALLRAFLAQFFIAADVLAMGRLGLVELLDALGVVGVLLEGFAGLLVDAIDACVQVLLVGQCVGHSLLCALQLLAQQFLGVLAVLQGADYFGVLGGPVLQVQGGDAAQAGEYVLLQGQLLPGQVGQFLFGRTLAQLDIA